MALMVRQQAATLLKAMLWYNIFIQPLLRRGEPALTAWTLNLRSWPVPRERHVPLPKLHLSPCRFARGRRACSAPQK